MAKKSKSAEDHAAAMEGSTHEGSDGESTRGRFLVLLRHGLAEEPSPAKSDAERTLTNEGHARMKEIARGLAEVFPKAEVVYSSPLIRAVQTALWVGKGYRSPIKVLTTDTLRPEATEADFRSFLDQLSNRRIVLVGHEPSLTRLARQITGVSGRVDLKKGGCYGIRLDGSGVLEWLLTPRVLRRLGRKK